MQSIRSIKIENFRCFKEVTTVNFNGCHSLIGENGNGKTAILEAIDLATSKSANNKIEEQDFNNADAGELKIEVTFSQPFLTKIPDGYTTQDIPCSGVVLTARRRARASAALSGQFVTEQSALPIAYAKGAQPVLPKDLKGNLPLAISKTEDGYEAVRKSGTAMSFSTRQLSLQHEVAGFPNVFYFDREREKESKVGFGSLLQKVAKDLNWRFRNKWDQGDIIARWEPFYQAVISLVDEEKGGRIIKPLQEKMRAFGGKDFGDLELSLLDLEQPFLRTFFSRREGTNQINQGNFGSGLSILLSYFLLEIISSLSKEDFVFLIDEPELHLHPQLQRRLLQTFHAQEFQIIYTTQSDCLVDIAKWRQISRFLNDFTIAPKTEDLQKPLAGKPVSDHLDEIKKWHQHESIFFREDNQIFFSSKCLLVEGPADKYGLPILAQKLGKELGNITIISCNGKSKIQYYQLLCKAFAIPFFTLFDLDGRKTDEGENKIPYESAESDARATYKTSFEEILGISAKAEHKTSKLLLIIDEIEAKSIPAEISACIAAIQKWQRT